MNRYRFMMAFLVAALACMGPVGMIKAQSMTSDEALASIATAKAAVAEAKATITKGKALVDLIPENSPLLPEVAHMLKEASLNWKVAVESLEGANESAAKIATATSPALADDYALLAKVNAAVALSGAKVVDIGLAYVEAVANDKTESLEIIKGAMQDALAASSQVKFNCDKVKNLISAKYSN